MPNFSSINLTNMSTVCEEGIPISITTSAQGTADALVELGATTEEN
jgi:hypothetical protein